MIIYLFNKKKLEALKNKATPFSSFRFSHNYESFIATVK